jgi:hypothetical protein
LARRLAIEFIFCLVSIVIAIIFLLVDVFNVFVHGASSVD